MSTFQHKPNRGSIFMNDRKQNEQHPDYRGDAVINGQEVWVSGWVNTRPDGSQYFSLAFQSKEELHNNGMAQVRAAQQGGIPTPQMAAPAPQAPAAGYVAGGHQQAPAPAQYAPQPQQAPHAGSQPPNDFPSNDDIPF